jgi:hypothetical protein
MAIPARRLLPDPSELILLPASLAATLQFHNHHQKVAWIQSLGDLFNLPARDSTIAMPVRLVSFDHVLHKPP